MGNRDIKKDEKKKKKDKNESTYTGATYEKLVYSEPEKITKKKKPQ